MKFSFLFLLFFLLVPISCSPSKISANPQSPSIDFQPPHFIIKKPISFSKKRLSHTRKYLQDHYGLSGKQLLFKPKMIVLHWTVTKSLIGAWNIFNNENVPRARKMLFEQGQANVSVPFLVDRKGKIYQIMRADLVARHVIGLNFSSIGVENIAGTKNKMYLNQKQVQANVLLIRYLVKKFPSIKYLVGHRETHLFKKAKHPLWLEKVKKYSSHKIDPDKKALSQIRNQVKDLNLLGPPKISLH